MQTAIIQATSRQRYVNCFCRQMCVHAVISQRLTACSQRSFDMLFGCIDACAFELACCRVKFAESLESLGYATRLAKETRLFIFQRGSVVRFSKGALCFGT